MDISAASKSIFPIVKMVGAETEEILRTRDESANLLKTAETIVSIPCKLPWLSKAGIMQVILKLARGEITWTLLAGVM
jgi:hypothetical protein